MMSTYRNTLFFIVALLPLMSGRLPAETDGTIEVADVLQHLRDRFQLVQDYQVDLEVSLDMPKLRMPRKRMTLTFKQPDKTQLEAKGFAMVPRRGLALSPDSLLKGMQQLQIGGDTVFNGHPCIVLQGSERTMDEMTMRVDILVDPELWVLRGITTFLDTVQVMRLVIDYTEPAPGIFLPNQTLMHFKIGESFLRSRARQRGPYGPDLPEPPLDVNGDSEGRAVIRFTNYQVNRGLPDSFFQTQ